MYILILAPNQYKKYNWGHYLFRREIGRQHDALYYGRGFPNYNEDLDVKDIVSKYCKRIPDFILSTWYEKPKGMEDVSDIPKVNITADYLHVPTRKEEFEKNKYDIIFSRSVKSTKAIREDGFNNVFYLPFSVDTGLYKKVDLPKDIDVLASFNSNPDVYPNRSEIIKMLNSMDDNLNIVAGGKVFHEKLIESINQSKISITSNNKWGSVSMKYTEILACGGFLLADLPDEIEVKPLGYFTGVHFVLYNNLDDLKDKIYYYLHYEEEREHIAENGMEFVRKNHSNEVRVKQFTSTIERTLGISTRKIDNG